MSAETDEVEQSSAPLIEHLAELRTRLIRSVGAFVVGIVLAFVVAEPILNFLLGPIVETLRDLGDPNPVMQFTSPQEYLFTLFRISMVFGFILAFPVIAHQLWRFVAPGLYKNEKQAFLPFIVASPVMFVLGAAFAHFVVTPLAMAFFLGFADAGSIFANAFNNVAEAIGGDQVNAPPVPDPGALLPPASVTETFDPSLNPSVLVPSQDGGPVIVFIGKVNESLDITLKFIMAFGICFQLPVLLTLMGKAGLVSAEGLGGVRKYAMVSILVLAALVTPPDVITQLILFTVVYGLYEVSIFLVRRVEKTREAKLRAEGVWFEDDEEEADEDLLEELDDVAASEKDKS